MYSDYIIGMFLSVMQLHGSLLTSYRINHQLIDLVSCPLIEFIQSCKQIGSAGSVLPWSGFFFDLKFNSVLPHLFSNRLLWLWVTYLTGFAFL